MKFLPHVLRPAARLRPAAFALVACLLPAITPAAAPSVFWIDDLTSR